MLKKISAALCVALLAMTFSTPSMSASAKCGNGCQAKCEAAVANGTEPSFERCVRKRTYLKANDLVELANASGKPTIVHRAHNYKQCIEFGSPLGYSMNMRESYCSSKFSR